MTNAFTAKPKADADWLKKANKANKSSRMMTRIMLDPKENKKRAISIMPPKEKR